jgi:cytochrome c peroxidase
MRDGSSIKIWASIGVAAAVLLPLCPVVGRAVDERSAFRRPTTIPFPIANPYASAKAELGRSLFFDTRLSRAKDRACASCHDPKKEFADGLSLSLDAEGRVARRHTPVLWNLAWGTSFFWDGRTATLEEQVREPIRTELGLPPEEAVERLADDPAFVERFAQAFPGEPRVTVDAVAAALATFVRTLVSPRNRFDEWVDGHGTALSPEEQRGFALFVGQAGCSRCHAGWNFTDQRFHDTGLAGDDRGRGGVLGAPELDHAFKTPTLRGVRWSQPFMHDGRIAKLRYVVEHYEFNTVPRPTLSPKMTPFALSDDEREDLVSFLRAIGDTGPTGPSGPSADGGAGPRAEPVRPSE